MLFCSCIQYIGMLPRYYRKKSVFDQWTNSHTTRLAQNHHVPERSSCIGDLGVWAPHHRSIVVEDCITVSSRPRTRSVQFQPRSRRFPAAVIHSLAEGECAERKKKCI